MNAGTIYFLGASEASVDGPCVLFCSVEGSGADFDSPSAWGFCSVAGSLSGGDCDPSPAEECRPSRVEVGLANPDVNADCVCGLWSFPVGDIENNPGAAPPCER